MVTTLCPNLRVADIERSIRFFTGLGYREVDRLRGPTGGAIRAALERDGHRICVEVAPPA